MGRQQCTLDLLWDRDNFFNVYERAIWLLKEYKNHVKDTQLLAL